MAADEACLREQETRHHQLQGGRFNHLTPALAQIALPVDCFIAFLREAPNDMPSFSADVLSDKDAADIHAFLSSLPGPRPAKDIPILNN